MEDLFEQNTESDEFLNDILIGTGDEDELDGAVDFDTFDE